MDLKRLTQASALLTATGTTTYVRVSAADGQKFHIGATVNLTSSGPNDAGLQISDIKGHIGTTDVEIFLIDPPTEAPFNATGYTVANSATITELAQSLWVNLGEDGVVKDVFTDAQMQTILLAVLPGGVGAASNVAVTNWPASQPVSLLTCPLPTGAATETTLGSILSKLNSSVAVTGTFWQATQPVSGTFWQATQPVSGTFWPTTQQVSNIHSTVGTAVAVPLSLVAVPLIAANPARRGFCIYNNSTGNLYVQTTGTASLALATVVLAPKDYYESQDDFDGAVSGIWDGGAGSAFCTEYT